MPTYNYYCSDCDAHFSYFQKMSDDAKTNCENCDGNIKRVITGGTGIIFKWSGFYLTDYKNEPKKEGKSESKINNSEKKSTGKKEKKSIE